MMHEELKNESKLLRGAQEVHDQLLKILEGRLENIESKLDSIIGECNNHKN